MLKKLIVFFIFSSFLSIHAATPSNFITTINQLKISGKSLKKFNKELDQIKKEFIALQKKPSDKKTQEHLKKRVKALQKTTPPRGKGRATFKTQLASLLKILERSIIDLQKKSVKPLQIDAWKKDVIALQAQLTQKEQALAAAQANLSIAPTALEREQLNKQISTLTTQLRQITEERDRVRVQAERAANELARTTATLATERMRTTTELERTAAELERINTTLTAAHTHEAALQSELNTARTTATREGAERGVADERVNRLTSELATVRGTIAAQENLLRDLHQKYAAKTIQRAWRSTKTLAQAKGAAKKLAQDLTEEITTLQAKLEAATTPEQRAQLEQEIARLNTRLEQERREHEEETLAAETAQQQAQERLGLLEQELAKTRDDIKASVGKRAVGQWKYTVKAAQKEKLEKELKEAKISGALAQASANVLENRAQEMANQIKNLQAQLAREQQNFRDELRRQEERYFKALETEHEKADAIINDLKKELAKRQSPLEPTSPTSEPTTSSSSATPPVHDELLLGSTLAELQAQLQACARDTEAPTSSGEGTSDTETEKSVTSQELLYHT